MINDQREYQRTYYDRHFGKRSQAVREQLCHPLFRSFYDRLANRLLDAAPPRRDSGNGGGAPPLRVLEAGCGEGLLAAALHRVAAERELPMVYTGADLSADALELVRESVEGKVLVGDAAQVVGGLPSGSQDLVVVKNLLHHMDDPGELMRQAARVVGPSGRVVVVEACLGCPQFWVFSLLAPKRERYFFHGRRRNLAALEEGGLRVLDTSRFNWLPYELAFAIRFNWFRRLFNSSDVRFIERASHLDDRLTELVPALACYIVWVTTPVAIAAGSGPPATSE